MLNCAVTKKLLKMTKRCEICSIDFQDNYSYQGHIAGKRHQRNMQKIEQRKKFENSVFVPLPNDISRSEIVEFFLKFGKVERYHLGSNYILLEFAEREPVEYLLNNPIRFKDIRLTIRRRIQNNQQVIETTKESIIRYDKIKQIFEDVQTFEEQMQVFQSTVRLSEEEVEKRYEAARTHLNNIFKAVFPKCSMYRFGSTVTGLGLKECDLDIYLNIGVPIYENKPPTPYDWTPQKIFREVKKMMYRMNAIFSNMVPIPKAKTPIIKFLHIPTQVSCDISFKNSLAVHNSRLIKFCLSLDVRLTPLMILIKYWAKHFEISGSGRITNYALIMLTFFYLQQSTVKIIPPILELQKSCRPYVIDGWQINIDEKVTLPVVENSCSIPQLLTGFFNFYSTFEFNKKIICPLDGRAWSREDFKRWDDLPAYLHRYKVFASNEENATKLDDGRPMCVQDPIELAHNVTASTGQRIVETFKALCVIGADICAKSAKEDYKNLLPTLFTTMPKIGKKVEFKIPISPGRLLNVGLPADLETRKDITDKQKFIRDNWYFTIFNLTKDVFEKIFRLKVEILCIDKEAKQQKIEVLSDVHSKDHQTILLHCTGTHCVWRNRKPGQTVLDPSLSCLEKEALISERLIEDLKSSKDKNSVNINFMCKFEKKVKPLHVILLLTDENCSKKVFHEFGSFLKFKLPKIIEKTLMHMRQYNKHY